MRIKVGQMLDYNGTLLKSHQEGPTGYPCSGCYFLNEDGGCNGMDVSCDGVTWREVGKRQDSHMGRVFVMDIEDFNILSNLARELMQSWDGLTMGEAFEKRRSIAKKLLYRLRGSIMNREDLGL